MKHFFLIWLAIIGLISAAPLAAEAFTISPPKYTFIVDPGERQSGTIIIKNTGSVSKIFYLSVVGARQNARGYPEFNTGFDAAESWVRLEQNSATVGPNATASIVFSVAVPANAPPLAHYVGISVDEVAKNSGAVGVTGRLVALVYLQVAGKVTESLRVARFSIQPSAFWETRRFANLTVVNSGTVPVVVQGHLQLTNRAGAVLFNQIVSLGNELLPGSERRLVIPFSLTSALLLPGEYQATMLLEYGRAKQHIRAGQSIIFIPLWSVGLALLLPCVLVAGWFIWRRAKRSFR